MHDDGLPLLLPYQSAWNEEPADVAVCEKSRRIGLSWGDAAERVVHAAEGRGNVYYMSYDKDMTRGYVNDCADWAKRLGAAVSEVCEEVITEDERDHQVFVIRFASGKEVMALSSLPRALRSKGRPGDVLIVDEAAFVDNLDEVLKAGMAFTQWGGKVRIISTHNGADSTFGELVEDIRAGRLPYALHRITLDDAIEQGLARRICSVKGDRWHGGYAAEWRDAQVAKYRRCRGGGRGAPLRAPAGRRRLAVPRPDRGVHARRPGAAVHGQRRVQRSAGAAAAPGDGGLAR